MDLVLNNLLWLICHKTQPTDDDVMSCKTDLWVKVLLWKDRCTGAIPLSRPGKSCSSGTENRYDGRLPGCSGWPGLLWVPRPAVGAPTTRAATAFTTVGSSDELLCLFRRESGFACSRADTAQFKLTKGLKSIGYPHLFYQAHQSQYPGCGRRCMRQLWRATGETWVPGEVQWQTSCPKRTWRTPFPKVQTTPWTPHTPDMQ